MSTRADYIIAVRDVASPGAPPPEVRLRRMLKLLARYFGFRCVDVTTAPHDESHKTTQPPHVADTTPENPAEEGSR